MKVNCCWNDAHVSTMTEDRANPVLAGSLGAGAQSLARWGIPAIAAVSRRGLKRLENVPFGEFWGSLADGFGASSEAKKIRARWRGFRRCGCRCERTLMLIEKLSAQRSPALNPRSLARRRHITLRRIRAFAEEE